MNSFGPQLKIVAISDTHGTLQYITLKEHADVLVIAGDFSPLKLQSAVSSKEKRGTMKEWIRNTFIPWLLEQPVDHVVFIPGNHDWVTEQPWFTDWFNGLLEEMNISDRIHYLCNSSITIGGVTFWGCPYSDLPNWAWYSKEDIRNYVPPTGTDVMIVHAAPKYDKLGLTYTRWSGMADYGSIYLTSALCGMEELPKLLICGHIHGGCHQPTIYGSPETCECVMLNVSVKDEEYSEAFDPTYIDLTIAPDNTAASAYIQKSYQGYMHDCELHLIHCKPISHEEETI